MPDFDAARFADEFGARMAAGAPERDAVRCAREAGDRSTRRAALALVGDIFPLCRSITGDGVRETLRRVARHVPLEVFEVPSGTPVFDWEVPLEWNVREAYIADGPAAVWSTSGRHALHVVGYSVPVRARMTLRELRPHLHTLPERPDWIPYRTSYYREAWGFCLRPSGTRRRGPTASTTSSSTRRWSRAA